MENTYNNLTNINKEHGLYLSSVPLSETKATLIRYSPSVLYHRGRDMASLLEIASEHLPSEVTSKFIMNQMAVVNFFGTWKLIHLASTLIISFLNWHKQRLWICNICFNTFLYGCKNHRHCPSVDRMVSM